MSVTTEHRDVADLRQVVNDVGEPVVQVCFMGKDLAIGQAAQHFINFSQQQLVGFEHLGGMLEHDIGRVGDAITRCGRLRRDRPGLQRR